MSQAPSKKRRCSGINNRLLACDVALFSFCQNEGNVLWKVSQISHLLGPWETERPDVHITALCSRPRWPVSATGSQRRGGAEKIVNQLDFHHTLATTPSQAMFKRGHITHCNKINPACWQRDHSKRKPLCQAHPPETPVLRCRCPSVALQGTILTEPAPY